MNDVKMKAYCSGRAYEYCTTPTQEHVSGFQTAVREVLKEEGVEITGPVFVVVPGGKA